MSLVAELSELLPGAIVMPQGERAAAYERDESGLGRYPPQAVVLARSTEDVSALLRYARKQRLPVVPRGAGSGKSGGALAERGGIVLSLETMNRIVEVSRADMVCAVQPIFDAGLLPRACELFDGPTMRAVGPRAPFKFPEGVGGALLVEHDGHGDGVAEELARSGELCAERGAIDVLAAQDEAQRRKLWETRRMTSVALTEIRPFKISEDVAVPRGQLVEMIRAVRRIGENHGFATASYGHAGDGNLHVNLLFASADERLRGEGAIDEVIETAIRLGGTITGEHGVGLAKRRFLRKEQGEAVVALQKRLKRAFDPEDLLNPGKIFP